HPQCQSSVSLKFLVLVLVVIHVFSLLLQFPWAQNFQYSSSAFQIQSLILQKKASSIETPFVQHRTSSSHLSLKVVRNKVVSKVVIEMVNEVVIDVVKDVVNEVVIDVVNEVVIDVVNKVVIDVVNEVVIDLVNDVVGIEEVVME
ncbi:hypothetical protein Tco_0172258, partial [Tanacetum coccineum]